MYIRLELLNAIEEFGGAGQWPALLGIRSWAQGWREELGHLLSQTPQFLLIQGAQPSAGTPGI